jgi:tetratricopeptide (TPR) repeat protein
LQQKKYVKIKLKKKEKYEEAEETVKKALKINEDDSWAIHAYVHIMEMKKKTKQGIEYLKKYEESWSVIFIHKKEKRIIVSFILAFNVVLYRSK